MLIYRQNYAALIFIPRARQRKPILSIRPRASRSRSRHRKRHDAPIGTTRPALDLLPRIQQIAFKHSLNDTRIGREAIGDPNLVHEIKVGRRLRDQTRTRLIAYIERMESGEA